MIATEQVIGEAPFTVRRRVKWGDCDPAGVVYTVVFSEYIISAAELFYGYLFATTPQRAKSEHGFGTPTKALNIEFHSSLRPDEEFDMTVRVKEIRKHTYTLHIDAVTQDGIAVFSALLTVICIARGERKAILVPDVLRNKLQHELNSHSERSAAG
jgi:YbgC/YbaW family acyl-CoA thioester hydrolase